MFEQLQGSRQGQPLVLSPEEAVAGLLIALAESDGAGEGDEMGELVAAERRMAVFRSSDDERKKSMHRKLFGIVEKRGAPFLLTLALRDCPKEHRAPAFARAVSMVLSDGIVEQEEKEILRRMKKELAIPDDLANTIVQVMKIWHRG